jgi:hypothetical protein
MSPVFYFYFTYQSSHLLQVSFRLS